MPRKKLTAEERQERAERACQLSKYMKEAYIACLNGADPNDFPFHGWKYSNAVEAYKARVEQRRWSQKKRTEKRRALKRQSKNINASLPKVPSHEVLSQTEQNQEQN